MRKSVIFALGLLVAALGTIAAVSYYQEQPLALATSFEFPVKKPLVKFKLTDQNGKVFDNSRLKGKWTLFFAGYTSCPDICPTAMSKLSAAYPKLRTQAPFQIVFISVDPKRDTLNKLKDYTAFFNKDFIAVTGEHKALLPITRNLGMAYTMIGDGPNYLVDHSASMTLVSPKGERVAVIKPQSSPGKVPQIKNKDLIADIHSLINKLS
ncbi:MAG: SCO family protein [Parashewanella sp.]